MARHFNGTYSVRAGYHGPRKYTLSNSIGSNFVLCEKCNRYIPRTAFEEHCAAEHNVEPTGATGAAQKSE